MNLIVDRNSKLLNLVGETSLQYVRCVYCHRLVKDPDWVRIGIGRTCHKKHGHFLPKPKRGTIRKFRIVGRVKMRQIEVESNQLEFEFYGSGEKQRKEIS